MLASNFLAWSALLFFQNISFTYVSRARNSGSLPRHIKAAVFSNGIWIVSNMVMLGPMLDSITGKHGLLTQIVSALVYTVATVSGGVAAHFMVLRTEKGKSAVGANKLYAQVPVAEWQRVQNILGDYERVKSIAENAYAISVGTIPDSGVSASKAGGQVVTTGL